MKLNGVEIADTFAEAFDIKVSRFLITANDYDLAMECAKETTGFATSIIMCPAEAGVDVLAKPKETPDGRMGVYVMICHPKKDGLEKQLLARIGQCVLPFPTTAVFDALPNAKDRFRVGYKMKFFGDGFEEEIEVGGRRCWKIPIMEGEFIIEDSLGFVDGVAGGNFIIMAETQASALMAAKSAVDAISTVEGVITPFPIVASGSKVGAKRYSFLKASTNERFCPSLRNIVKSEIPEGVKGVYEIVINGINESVVREAMKIGIESAVKVRGVMKITSANFEGKLGRYRINLHDLF